MQGLVVSLQTGLQLIHGCPREEPSVSDTRNSRLTAETSGREPSVDHGGDHDVYDGDVEAARNSSSMAEIRDERCKWMRMMETSTAA
eukprot:1837723-Rhodomonas_salina.1